MSFTVNVKRYSTEGGYVSAKAVIGKYGSSSYDVSITGSNDLFNMTYVSGKYAIEVYNPSGYSFSSIDTNLPGLAFGDSLTNGRYYTFTPSNGSSYYVKIYYKPSITYYSVRVRSDISSGNGKFGQLNTSTYDEYWSGKNWSKSVSMPAGTNVAVEVKNVAGYTISSVDYCPYAGEISGGKYFVKYGLSSNLDIVVHYSANTYTVSLDASPSGGGSVSGGGDYSYGDTAYISASPSANYRFVKWSDGNTNASRSFTGTGDVSLTAYFEYIGVTVNISSNGGGSVSVKNTRTGASGTSVTGIVGDTFVFSGTPSTGYSKAYVQLSGSSNQIAYGSNYTIGASGTYNFTGYFTPNQYTISVSIGSGEYNSYYSGGTYDYGTAYEMWVEVNPHYVFHYWEDSDGNRIYPEDQGNNRYIGKIVVTKNVEYTLVASPKVYSISVSANPSDGGSVSGGGEYTYNRDVTLEAVANSGYRFDHWSDGSKENPHIVKAVEDKEYVAYFYANTFNVVLSSSPSNGGTVSGGGTYVNGTVAKLKATPNKGYKFSRWSDGNTSASRQITVTSNINLTAYFIKLSYNIEGYPIPDHAGEVDGSDTYYYGERAVLTAYPIDLHRFLEWSDGDSSNPKKFTVNKNISLAAEFERWPNVFVGSNRVKFIAIGGSLIKRLSIGDTNAYLD